MRRLLFGMIAGVALGLPVTAGSVVLPWPLDLQFDFCWDSGTCGTAVWTLQQAGDFRSSGGSTGLWTRLPRYDRLILSYDAGTQYSGRRISARCYEGEMVSYTGSTGVWSGCFIP